MEWPRDGGAGSNKALAPPPRGSHHAEPSTSLHPGLSVKIRRRRQALTQMSWTLRQFNNGFFVAFR